MDSSKKYELVKYDRNNLNVRMGLHRHIGQPELVAQVFDDAETTDKRFLAKFGLRTNTSDLNKELMLLVEKRIKLTRQKLNLKNINQ